MLTEQDTQNIADKVVSTIKSNSPAWLDDHTIQRNHAWVSSRIEKEREMSEMRKKIIQSSVAWALPIVLGFVCVAIWNEARAAFSS